MFVLVQCDMLNIVLCNRVHLWHVKNKGNDFRGWRVKPVRLALGKCLSQISPARSEKSSKIQARGFVSELSEKNLGEPDAMLSTLDCKPAITKKKRLYSYICLCAPVVRPKTTGNVYTKGVK